MALKFYGALNLDGQQLINASLEVRSAVVDSGAGADYEGRLIFVQDSDGDTLRGTLQFKSAAAGTATWTSLSGAGAVISLTGNPNSGLSFDLIDNSALETNDEQTISVDYTSSENFVLLPGDVSDETVLNTTLSDIFFIYNNSSNAVKKNDAEYFQTVIQAGVSSADTGEQAVDSNIEVLDTGFISDTNGQISFSADLRADFPPATTLLQRKFFYLKATGLTGTEWDYWIPLSDTLYRLDVDTVAAVAGVSGDSARINFVEGTTSISTIDLVPTISTPDAGGAAIPRQIEMAVFNSTNYAGNGYSVFGFAGGVRFLLSDSLKINGTLTVGTGVFEGGGDVIFSGGTTAFTTLNNQGTSSQFTNVTDSNAIEIIGAADAFGHPHNWVNKAYVDFANDLAGQITYKGTYNATEDPPTSGVKGDLWVVTTPGNGYSSDNYVDDEGYWTVAQSGGWLREGDMIIAKFATTVASSNWILVQGNIDVAEQGAVGIARFHDGSDADYPDGGWEDLSSWDGSGLSGAPQPRGYTLAASIGNEATHAPLVTVQKFGKISAIGNRASETQIQLDHNNNFTDTTTFDNAVQVKVLARKAHGLLPNDTATPYRFVHSLATKDVLVDVYDANTGDTVFAEVTRSNINYIDLSGISALTEGDLRVTAHDLTEL